MPSLCLISAAISLLFYCALASPTNTSVSDDTRPPVYVLCINAADIVFDLDPVFLQYSFDYINNELAGLFPAFQLKYKLIQTDGPATSRAIKAFIDGYLQPPNMALILGASYSLQSQTIADVGKLYSVTQIGYSNTSPDLSDTTLYPFYFRMSTSFLLYIKPTLDIIHRFGWKRIGIISNENAAIFAVTQDLIRALDAQNTTTYQKTTFTDDPTEAIVALLSENFRIFVVLRHARLERPEKRFECVLKTLGAYGPKFLWIQVGLPLINSVIYGSCPNSERAISLEGSIEFDDYVSDSNIFESEIGPAGKNITELFADFLVKYPSSKGAVPNTLVGFGLRFDTVLAAAVALNATVNQFNYSESLQLENSSFKMALFKNVQNLNFVGVSGKVRFNKNGDRLPRVLIYQIRSLKRQLVATVNEAENITTWHRDIWFAGGQPPTDALLVETRTLAITRSQLVIIVTLAAVGIILALASVSVNLSFQHLRFIRMSSPRVNSVIGFGCVMCYASCIVMACNTYWNTSATLCRAQEGLISIGYSLAYGAMFAKTWRVHKIFTQKGKRVIVQDWHLFLVILAVTFVDAVLLAVRGIVNPIYLETNYLPDQEGSDGTILKTRLITCSSINEAIWTSLIIGYKGIFLIFGIFFAWETRSVHVEALNDSKNIGLCIYNTTVVGVIGVVMAFALPESSLSLKILLIACCVLVCTTTTVIIVFGSKIFALMKHGPSRVDSVSLASMQSAVGTQPSTA